jgi:hypothetical protein
MIAAGWPAEPAVSTSSPRSNAAAQTLPARSPLPSYLS